MDDKCTAQFHMNISGAINHLRMKMKLKMKFSCQDSLMHVRSSTVYMASGRNMLFLELYVNYMTKVVVTNKTKMEYISHVSS